MFDSLADQIVDRVKKELNLNSTGQMPMDQRVDRKVYSPKAYASGRVSSKTSTTKIDSHYCPGCGLLMLAPENSPMLIIPCGHSFCKTCSESTDSCLNCKETIHSLTCNIMLQQIISEYNGRDSSTTANVPQEPTRGESYQPGRYEEVDHSEEYQSLCVRCEAVSAEVEDIEQKIENFDQNIVEEEQQIRNITSAQDKINMEIHNLQTKMADLERHKEEYNNKIEAWIKKRENSRKKLKMTQDMLRQLEREKDKVAGFLKEK